MCVCPACVSLQSLVSFVAPGSKTGDLDPLEFTGWDFVSVGHPVCPAAEELRKEGAQGVELTAWCQHKTPPRRPRCGLVLSAQWAQVSRRPSEWL